MTNQAPRRLRAFAVLACLRTGSRSIASIRSAIGDKSPTETESLLRAMQAEKMVIVDRDTGRWYLDFDGFAWLQRDGLDADDEAKNWKRATRNPAADGERAAQAEGATNQGTA